MQTRLGETSAVRGRSLSEGRGAKGENAAIRRHRSAIAPGQLPCDSASRIFSCHRILSTVSWGLGARPKRSGKNRRVRRSRSEEHTSELQSQSNLVCRLLLEKKKN